jgi:hypothetical protein
VNLQVQDAAGLAVLARLRAGPGAPDAIPGAVPIEPPPPPNAGGSEGGGFCVGYCYPARLGHLPAAIVVPHVPDYPPDKLELVAAVRVRDALGLQPGDRVVVTIQPPLPLGEGGGEGSP